MREMDDKMGQVQVLSSMAKQAFNAHRHDTRQCECQVVTIYYCLLQHLRHHFVLGLTVKQKMFRFGQICWL